MLHVIAIAEMFWVQNSTRNQSKPKQSHGHCVRCEVIKTGSPQNNHRQYHEYNNYSSLEYDRRWRISPLFFQFSYHIFGQLNRINKQLVANHAIVLVKQTTLFEYETPVTTCRFTNSYVLLKLPWKGLRMRFFSLSGAL